MSARFEELDWRETPMGAISLRRRRDVVTGDDVFEVKLDDDYLMSSLYTVAEVAVARAGLDALTGGDWDVAVGGLGLGYTARAVLDDPAVRSLVVIDALGAVIDWHRRGLVPLGEGIANDPRCRLVEGDFIECAVGGGIDPTGQQRTFDAVIVDIDHSPRHLLHPSHARFYTDDGIAKLAEQLVPGGVFALWSNDPPDEDYCAALSQHFRSVRAEVVEFPGAAAGSVVSNTVFVAVKA